MTTVGFVGLGNMGAPMARNLINAGHSLKVYDLDEDKVNMLVQAGTVTFATVDQTDDRDVEEDFINEI